jgi:diadenosine tetraphosphate (Ap4A) HIT family hydrolase
MPMGSAEPVDCQFCEYIREPDGLLWETEHVAVRFGRPHHKGHTQVLLRRHEEDLTALTEAERDAFFDQMIYVAQVVQDVLEPDLLNYQLLGNWVPHLHWHIYPRYRADPDFGDPPAIPLRDEPFEPLYPSDGEVELLKAGLAKCDPLQCPQCLRTRFSR